MRKRICKYSQACYGWVKNPDMCTRETINRKVAMEKRKCFKNKILNCSFKPYWK